MCGFYYTNLNVSPLLVKEKLKKICHRGPNNLSVQKFENNILGHLRLSIIDVGNRSNQPMNYDGLYIIYNGEVYNYKSIKKELENKDYKFDTSSDTEVLLKGYHYYGNKILNKLNGMFSFLIYDSKKSKLFFAKDRTGQKPLYYRITEKGIEISSQTTCFETKKISEDAISLYLELGYIPAPFSIYDGINNLIPGHYVEYDLISKKYKERKYWELPSYKPNKKSFDFNKETLKKLLEDSVKLRLNADVNVGIFLSSGIDSSLISIISKNISKNIRTLTVGFENKSFDETNEVNNFTSHFKIQNESKILLKKNFRDQLVQYFDSFDEPFSDESSIAFMILSKSVSKNFKVVLSGDGSDESFLGYNKFFISFKTRLLFLLPGTLRRFIINIFKIFFKNNHNKLRFLTNLTQHKNLFEYIDSLYYSKVKLTSFDTKSFIKKHYSNSIGRKSHIQYSADLRTKLWISNSNNVKVDRASMAYSIEARNPFLDYRVIEFSREIPIYQRGNRKSKKDILKKIMKDYDPRFNFSVSKKGFSIPIMELFGQEIFNELKIENFNWIKDLNKGSFKRILKEHEVGKIDHSKILWRLYILHLWKKRMFTS